MLHPVYPQQMVSNFWYSVPLNLQIYLLTLSQDGFASLHVACQEGHAQVGELLIQAGASVEQETKVRWRSVLNNVHS